MNRSEQIQEVQQGRARSGRAPAFRRAESRELLHLMEGRQGGVCNDEWWVKGLGGAAAFYPLRQRNEDRRRPRGGNRHQEKDALRIRGFHPRAAPRSPACAMRGCPSPHAAPPPAPQGPGPSSGMRMLELGCSPQRVQSTAETLHWAPVRDQGGRVPGTLSEASEHT